MKLSESQQITWSRTGAVRDSLFTENHIIITVEEPVGFYCLTRLNYQLNDEKLACPTQELNTGGAPLKGSWRVSANGNRLFMIWYLGTTDFNFKNITYAKQGTFVMEMNLNPVTDTRTTSVPSMTPTEMPRIPQRSAVTSFEYLYLIVGIVLVIILIVILLVVFHFRRNKSWKKSEVVDSDATLSSIQTTSTLFTSNLPLAIPGYFEVEKSAFRQTKVIAQGGAGIVSLVQLLDPSLIERVNATTAVAKQIPAGNSCHHNFCFNF